MLRDVMVLGSGLLEVEDGLGLVAHNAVVAVFILHAEIDGGSALALGSGQLQEMHCLDRIVSHLLATHDVGCAERAFGGAVAQVGGCGEIRDGLREMALVLLSSALVQLLARGAGRDRDVHGTDAAILVAAGCAMGGGGDVVRTIVSTLLL